jgi:hypothetical protein
MLVVVGVMRTSTTLLPWREGRHVHCAISVMVATLLQPKISRPFARKFTVPLCPAVKESVVEVERETVFEGAIASETGLSSGGR